MRITLNIVLFCLIIFIGTDKCIAQNNIIYRNHFLHQVFTNPAVSGSEFFPVANLSYQKQWLGISQSPQTLIASTSLRLGNFDFYNPKMFINKSGLKAKERIGMGIGIYSDRNGPVINRGINLAYAYHLSLQNSRFSFGLSGSAEQSVLDESKWNPVDPNDPSLGSNRESYFHYNANFGVYFYSVNYFVGFAANHLIPFESKLKPGENVKQDYILHGGYLFGSMKELKLEPSVNFRYLDYEELEFDVQLKAYIKHVHWVALAYRSYKAIVLLAGFKIQKFYIAYSYEANLSPVIKYNAGTHGLNIGLNLGVRRLEGF